MLLLLGTERGTRFSVNQFLRLYNPVIPGEIVAKEISGTLLGGVVFRGVALKDRKRNPIIDVEEVHCKATLTALLQATIHVPAVRVSGARIFLRTYEGESSFVDLAP